MQQSRKRRPGWILIRTYPVAKYLAFLLIPLSLYRLSPRTWLLPGVTAAREWMMLWPALLMVLGILADRRARRALEQDAGELKKKDTAQGSHYLTFLAVCDVGLLLLDAAAIAHLYFSWYRSAAGQAEQPMLPLPLAFMAMGCVFWIYGCAVPSIPFGSIWGLRTRGTLSSPEAWKAFHLKSAVLFRAAGILLLAAGTILTYASA